MIGGFGYKLWEFDRVGFVEFVKLSESAISMIKEVKNLEKLWLFRCKLVTGIEMGHHSSNSWALLDASCGVE